VGRNISGAKGGSEMAADLRDNVEGLLKKIGNALDELCTLRVQTAITSMNVDKTNGEWSLAPAPGDQAQGISTTIRLDQGDIQNALSEGALENEKLMAIHTQQVTMSREIVSNNLKALAELAQSLLK